MNWMTFLPEQFLLFPIVTLGDVAAISGGNYSTIHRQKCAWRKMMNVFNVLQIHAPYRRN